MLVIARENILGTSAIVKITSVGRWSVFGEVIETIKETSSKTASSMGILSSEDKCSPCSNTSESCVCSRVQEETCACGPGSCGGTTIEESAASTNSVLEQDRSSQNLIRWLLRKRKNHVQKNMESEIASGFKEKQEWSGEGTVSWNVIDTVLLGGMLVSFLIIVALLIHLGFRTSFN